MSVLCWLGGHKWQFTRRSQQHIKGGFIETTTRFFQSSHCQRCGKENPMWMGDASNLACRAIDVAKAK